MSQIIKNREIKVFSCYQDNIPDKVIKYQKKVFDYFGMELTQERTTLSHGEYLDSKINFSDFDIMIFFDIDAIPLKPNLYEYIIEQMGDNNSLIGVEQAANHIDTNIIYAGPACFAISKIAYEKINKPSFATEFTHIPGEKLSDCAGNLSFAAKKYGVNVKLFHITSSLNNKWKCGNNHFGNGTIYDDWIYHQFEIRYPYVIKGEPTNKSGQQICEFQFINKCKNVMGEDLFDDKEINATLKEIQNKWQV